MDTYELGYKNWVAEISVLNNGARVHIREKVAGRFTKRGIALEEDEWLGLVLVADAILEDAGALREIHRYIGTRGRRVYVRTFKGSAFVHIRSFWDKAGNGEEIPTKIGAALNLHGFKELMAVAPLVTDDLEKALADLAKRKEQHDNTMAYRKQRLEEIEKKKARMESVRETPSLDVDSTDDEIESSQVAKENVNDTPKRPLHARRGRPALKKLVFNTDNKAN